MITWLVSRHRGAIEWVNRQGIHVDRIVDHLDVNVNAMENGHQVIGNLPIHMAAAVCERGVRYLHLQVNVPREMRGQELNARQLMALGAQLIEFQVKRCDSSLEPLLRRTATRAQTLPTQRAPSTHYETAARTG